MKTPKEIYKYFSVLLKRFLPLWRLYGFSVAFSSLIFPFCHLFGPLKPYIAMHKHRAILIYLRNRYAGLLNNYLKNSESMHSTIEYNSTIWVCWWDGEGTMPPLVKSCYNSIIKHSSNHPVMLITKENYKNYISIPEYIIEKVSLGIMSLTHFSNILRVNLLYDYGGIWMDITILALKDISLEGFSFFTLKALAKTASVTLNTFEGISSTHPFHICKETPVSRWSGFLLGGTKSSPFFSYLRDILYAYWKDHNDQIDYLLFDYTIALGYDNIPSMKKLIDNVPCSKIDKYLLERNLNKEFSKEDFRKYSLETFNKLTWKKKFITHTLAGKLTVYGHILETFLEN